MTKTLEQYREQVDGAPIDLLEAAQRACDVTDDAYLRIAAAELVDAHEAFEAALEEREIELG